MGCPKELKLKKHETFSIREGWLEKGINYVVKEPLCFSKDNGTRILGLGSNMVKSLRYWVQAANLVAFNKSGGYLTKFGETVYKYDKYLEDEFTLWFVHLNIIFNCEAAPVFNRIFNLKYTKFDKTFLRTVLEDYFVSKGHEIKSISSLDSDITVFLKSYCKEEENEPENNMICPLSKLNLLSSNNHRDYQKRVPSYNDLDYRVVYYALSFFFEKNHKYDDEGKDLGISFNIEDVLNEEDNPKSLLNLNQSLFFVYLDEMKKNKLIRLEKTAGLNVVYVDKVLSIESLFKSKFEGGKENV